MSQYQHRRRRLWFKNVFVSAVVFLSAYHVAEFYHDSFSSSPFQALPTATNFSNTNFKALKLRSLFRSVCLVRDSEQ
jgi:hypothetical protein